MIEILNPRLAKTLDLELIRKELPGVEILIQTERRDLKTRKPDVIDETWKERARQAGYRVG